MGSTIGVGLAVPLWRPMRRLLPLTLALGASTALVLGMWLTRAVIYEPDHYHFLIWNLFLAWLPVALALMVSGLLATRNPLAPWIAAAPALAWLTFLPNSPYLLTDLIHLVNRADLTAGAPLWFDAVLLGSFAFVGMLLGLCSLLIVHDAVARRAANPLWGWGAIALAIPACSFGIWLGRFERWNTWDLANEPTRRAYELGYKVANPLSNPRMVGVTLIFSGLLATSYLVLAAIARLGRATEDIARLGGATGDTARLGGATGDTARLGRAGSTHDTALATTGHHK